MLHIINSFPITPSVLDTTTSGDTVIFTENAVFAVTQINMENQSFTQKTLNHINLYVRKADLLIRNISNSELLKGVVILDELQYENAITQTFAIKSNN